MKFLIASIILPFAAIATSHAQIYADFTTSQGNFTCELNHTASPKAVANFIGLAEGSRAWIDPVTGAVKTGAPYYDGLTFHRVIKDFMNQSGSRNGLGTDGPGYQFEDELANGLTHNAFVLSMANSGAQTNGAQFFITAVATPWLNGIHTVFGTVTSGQSVITTINNVPTASDKPVTPVLIQSVKIRRVGSAAAAFDINAQQLPVVTGGKGILGVVPNTKSEFLLPAATTAGTTLNVSRSTDLQGWEKLSSSYLGIGGTGTSTLSLDGGTLPKAFYNISKVVTPGAMTPESNANRVLAIAWSEDTTNYTFRFTFNGTGAGGTGVYSVDGTSRAYVTTQFNKVPFQADWVVNIAGFGSLWVKGAFTGQTSTQFTGTQSLYQYSASGWGLIGSGTFTLTK